jgi:hypothetical protein
MDKLEEDKFENLVKELNDAGMNNELIADMLSFIFKGLFRAVLLDAFNQLNNKEANQNGKD